MSKVAIKGANTGTGTFTIESPATNTDRTLSLPDATGTILTTATAGVPVNGPAFSATDTATTATAATATKIVFDTEQFDTDNAFDGTKFQPTVAGYYQVNCATTNSGGTNAGSCTVSLYKNNALYQAVLAGTVAGYSTGSQLSIVVFLNGSTDYLEVYGRNASNANLGVSAFSACLVRSAT